MKSLKSFLLPFWFLIWKLQTTNVKSFSSIANTRLSNPSIRHSKLYHHHDHKDDKQDDTWHSYKMNRREMLSTSMIFTSTIASSFTKPSNTNAIIPPQVNPNHSMESEALQSIQNTNTCLWNTNPSIKQYSTNSIMISQIKSIESIESIDPRYFIAGGTCASISHGLATPFDVIKTRIQAEPEQFQTKNIIQSIQIILKDDDTHSTSNASILLSGLAPTMIGYFVEGAFKFGIYEALKPNIFMFLAYAGFSTHFSTFLPFLLASAIAGALASILLCPMEDARIKMVTDPSFFDKPLIQIFPQLIQQYGILSLFSGLPAMLTKQVPYTIMKQVSFDYFTSSLYTFTSYLQSTTYNLSFTKFEISLLSAFVSSILACIASHPGDVLLTETYKPKIDKTDKTIFTISESILKTDGIYGFFSGFQPRLVHVVSIITTQLILYDFIKQFLGLPVTGSH